ncbi:MAG: hypothetical protein EZS28_034162 [Streblomastix strix]|uniref:Protein kinase domain-containing protein n=1 Tax=Streblomastix strix TaxID=222440 RepID=A0A5J4UJQ9_9EUKA|nr:MAG: hypothetical protein EZS28_034162 [Streblomastix strix]
MNKTPISSPLGPIVVGQFVGSNFAIEKILAVGSNCTIFSAKLNGNPQAAPTALKVENDEPSRNALAKEIHILRSIQNTKHFAKIIESGHHRQFNYVVIQLLGPSLRDLALRQPSYTFSLKILLKFAYQAIEALQTLHQAAFLHGSVNAVIRYKPLAPSIQSISALANHSTLQTLHALRQKSPEEDLVDVIKIISEYHTAQENEVDMINTV